MPPQLHTEFPARSCKEVGNDIHDAGSPPDRKLTGDLVTRMSHENEQHDTMDEDQNVVYPRTGTLRTAEDGYNWRKYGQKQVKGSEYPRSYYKCTHPNCQVKKKVERSHDGQITEIIYKSAHNHPQPQPFRKPTSNLSLPFNETSEIGECSDSTLKANSPSVWRNMESAHKDVFAPDWGIEGLTPPMTEVTNPHSTTEKKPMGVLESEGTPEFSSTMANHEDEEEDAATQENLLIGHANENEPDSKRRYSTARFGFVQ